MISNYSLLPEGSTIQVFPIRDSNTFGPPSSWKKQSAYYFTGLAYRMLICPTVFASDELLLTRPPLYLKANLPICALIHFPELPVNHNHNDFLDDLDWMVNSYLFKFNSTRPPFFVGHSPRCYVDYANNPPYHGPFVFDSSRVIASPEARDELDLINRKYSNELINVISSQTDKIQIANYAETTLHDEICSHENLLKESLLYCEAISQVNPTLLERSVLTKGWEHISCSKKYNRVVLSFYMAAIKEPFPNVPGSYIGMYKNFYNVLEYLMEAEGEAKLTDVLMNNRVVGIEKLKQIVLKLKSCLSPQSHLLDVLKNGERLSTSCTLPPVSENDQNLAATIAHRLYEKRNAVIHSKKTHRGAVKINVKPGPDESFLLEADLAIIRPIAEMIVEELDPDE